MKQKYTVWYTVILAFAGLFVLNACATIFSGSHQKVNLDSEPSGAKVYVDGMYIHKRTPCKVYVSRKGVNKSRQHKYILKKEGYEDYVYQDAATFNPVTLTNFLWGGSVLGMGIDWMTGSIYKYNREVMAILNDEEIEYALNEDPEPKTKVAAKTSANYTKKDDETGEISSDVDINIPRVEKSYPYRFALIIGNEEYSTHQLNLASEVDVEFARNDAKSFKKYAENTLGIPQRNIVFLTDATTGQMHQAISKMNLLAKNSYGKAEIFFYYAGHGLPHESTQEPYLMPVDISGKNVEAGLKLKDIYAKLTEHPNKRVTVFLDACFSGGARNQGLLAARGVKIEPKDTGLKGNLIVYTASSGIQSALPYREKYHGFFTYYLLKKFQETGGDLTYQELSDYLKEKVGLESVLLNDKEQNPQVNISSTIRDEWKSWRFNE
mgnify:FL=1